MRRHGRVHLAVALVAIGLAAGCSSGAKTTAGTTTTTGAAATTTAAAAGAPDAAHVTAALKAAGLPVGYSVTYTASSDPNHLLGRPGGYTSKVNFVDTRLAQQTSGDVDTSVGGSVEVFPSAALAAARTAYLQRVIASVPALTEYDYQQGPVVLRLSKTLTPAQAAQYQTALRSAV